LAHRYGLSGNCVWQYVLGHYLKLPLAGTSLMSVDQSIGGRAFLNYTCCVVFLSPAQKRKIDAGINNAASISRKQWAVPVKKGVHVSKPGAGFLFSLSNPWARIGGSADLPDYRSCQGRYHHSAAWALLFDTGSLRAFMTTFPSPALAGTWVWWARRLQIVRPPAPSQTAFRPLNGARVRWFTGVACLRAEEPHHDGGDAGSHRASEAAGVLGFGLLVLSPSAGAAHCAVNSRNVW